MTNTKIAFSWRGMSVNAAFAAVTGAVSVPSQGERRVDAARAAKVRAAREKAEARAKAKPVSSRARVARRARAESSADPLRNPAREENAKEAREAKLNAKDIGLDNPTGQSWIKLTHFK